MLTSPLLPSKMRPSMIRSAESALRRGLLRRSYRSESPLPERKDAILGAAGGIGQPLSLLMKLNPLVSNLALYDIAGTPGVAIAKYCPNAVVNMISNPVNSTVPIASEVFKKAGTYDEKKLFGVTTLDVVRARTFFAGKAKAPVADVNVPVVGGHAGITILPLFSQATPASNVALSADEITALTKRTQDRTVARRLWKQRLAKGLQPCLWPMLELYLRMRA